ncbi:MAG TPA: aspartyl protease family protein, partial [Segetibacter sp.]
KVDRSFTSKQYRSYTSAGVIDVSALFKSDTLVYNQIQECYSNSGVTILMQAEGMEKEFMADCIKSLQKSTEKTLDEKKVSGFCSCQLTMVKEKRLTDAQMEDLSNPNSLLFYEMMSTCGNPFSDKDDIDNSWSEKATNDIKGPAIDTIKVITLNGMTYVRMKTGSMVLFWLLDTGAADLLINKDMETTLKSEGVLTSNNYLGTGVYEMANGMIDTCRKYRMNNIRIGDYSIDNIVVAVTDKGKKIIAGKSLLNKFSNWILDNKQNNLVLKR